MNSSALLLMLLISAAAAMSLPVQKSTETVTGLNGETIVVPCPHHRLAPGDVLEWRYENGDGGGTSPLLLRKDHSVTTVYDPRFNVSSDDGSSLLIGQGTPKDQRVYVCHVSSTHKPSVSYRSAVAVERLILTALTPEGPIAEGDDVTLKCRADGNPPPSSYNFHLKDQTVLVENSDTYTLTAVTRDSAGQYKCSLVDDETMEASLDIAVNYLDLSLSPTGKVVRMLGEPLVVKMEISPSDEDAKVSWTKDGEKMEAAPVFGKLSYTDAGSYACEVSSAGLTRRQSFDLVVEGSPVITGLTQNGFQNGGGGAQLTCEAQGVPEPFFWWIHADRKDESSYNETDGKATSKVTVFYRQDGWSYHMSVKCLVSNRLGGDMWEVTVPERSWVFLYVILGVPLCLFLVCVIVASIRMIRA